MPVRPSKAVLLSKGRGPCRFSLSGTAPSLDQTSGLRGGTPSRPRSRGRRMIGSGLPGLVTGRIRALLFDAEEAPQTEALRGRPWLMAPHHSTKPSSWWAGWPCEFVTLPARHSVVTRSDHISPWAHAKLADAEGFEPSRPFGGLVP